MCQSGLRDSFKREVNAAVTADWIVSGRTTTVDKCIVLISIFALASPSSSEGRHGTARTLQTILTDYLKAKTEPLQCLPALFAETRRKAFATVLVC